VEKAMQYEIDARGSAGDGGRVVQETRLWDPAATAPSPCAARRRPTTTGISRTLTCCPLTSTMSIDRSPVSARDLARILELQDQGVISGKIAKTVFEETARTGQPPETIIDAKGLVQVSDRAAIEAVVAQVLEDCPEEVAAYRGGKSKLIGFFVGQVMKATRGKANPQLVNQILRNQLDADA
jgi:Asp-tRNA(Asn)/Glu-tRNA(Gln) amidotransferase B subunit